MLQPFRGPLPLNVKKYATTGAKLLQPAHDGIEQRPITVFDPADGRGCVIANDFPC